MDSKIITASDDAMIHIWSAYDLMDDSTSADPPAPLFSFSEHTIGVTKLTPGLSAGAEDRFVSSSLDRTCRLWDLKSKSCLLTIVAPAPVTSCRLDVLETVVVVGCSDGSLMRINLFPDVQGRDFRRPVADVVHIDYADQNDGASVRYCGHKSAVTCLEWSADGSQLISGDQDGQVHFWNAASGQLLQSITNLDGPVVDICAMHKCTDLFTKSAPKSKLSTPPQLQKNFQRRSDTLIVQPTTKVKRDYGTLIMEESTNLDQQVIELQTEVSLLKAKNQELAELNQSLYRDMVTGMSGETSLK
jgi:pre-rRNA-processing protein IPI3